MKLLLVNFTKAHYHWGCTIKSLALENKILNLGFDLIPVTIKETKAWGDVPETQEGFNNKEIFKAFCERNPQLIEKLRSIDVLVINGEGTIHGGLRQSPLRLLYLAYIAKMHFKNIKSVQIINQQVFLKDIADSNHCYNSPNEAANQPSEDEQLKNDAEARHIYKMVYQSLDFVSVRERRSFEEVKDWNKIILSFDTMPLYIRDHFKPNPSGEAKNIVISGSVAWHEDGMPAIIDYMTQMANKGYIIKVLIGAEADPSLDDIAFVKHLEKHLPKDACNWQLIGAKSIDEWLRTLENATLLLSGRFSHTIAAACLSNRERGPRFATFNSSTLKVHALMEIFKLPAPLLYTDPTLLGVNENNTKRNKIVERTEEILAMAEWPNLMQDMCALAEKNFDGLLALKQQYSHDFLASALDSASAKLKENVEQSSSSSMQEPLQGVGAKKEEQPLVAFEVHKKQSDPTSRSTSAVTTDSSNTLDQSVQKDRIKSDFSHS